jgi:hypothetical protein
MCSREGDRTPDNSATESAIASLPALRFWPILAAIGLLLSALVVDAAINVLVIHFVGKEALTETPWKVLYFGHSGMLLVAVLWIAFFSQGNFRDWGFKAPSEGRYVYFALLLGLGFGIVMTVVDYAHNFATHLPPEHYSLSTRNIAGVLTFSGLYAGTVEEILFRGLLVTFLMRRMSGRIRLGTFDLHIGGVIVALLFCVSHVSSFWTESFGAAAGQQVYAFLWGVIYAYWYEKSGSLIPSIIGHNVGNFVEEVLTFAMVWHWS